MPGRPQYSGRRQAGRREDWPLEAREPYRPHTGDPEGEVAFANERQTRAAAQWDASYDWREERDRPGNRDSRELGGAPAMTRPYQPEPAGPHARSRHGSRDPRSGAFSMPEAPLWEESSRLAPHASARPARRPARRSTSWWRTRRGIFIALLAVVLLGAGAGAVDGLLRYSHDKSLASDGMRQLRAAQALLKGGQFASAALDPKISGQLDQDLTAAERDFSALRADLGAPAGTFYLAAHTPGVRTAFSSAAALAAAADETCLAGMQMLQAVTPVQAYLHGGVFAKTHPAPSGPPAPLTSATFTSIQAAWTTARGHLDSAIVYARAADLSALPGSVISASQTAQLRSLVANWPAIQSQLDQVDTWLAVAPQLLGVSTPEHYLMVLQDRTELRATGGFMGNNALITLAGGRIQPFHLEDTYLLDRPFVAKYGPLQLPSGYPWWPFGSFALRDANLSPNFPTSARLERQFYQQEAGVEVSGVIAITPALIESILKVTGSLHVAGYPDVVTATNLEQTIHRYQLGTLAASEAQRKAFTAALGQSLLATIQKLSLAEQEHLVALAMTLFRSRDIQVWLANPKAEALLASEHLDASLLHGADTVAIVDTNVGGNKANQFVTIQYVDQVTVDTHGAATHHLTITYHFHAVSVLELYGPDRYHTYLRIYTPSNDNLRNASGFNFSYITPNSFGPSDVPGYTMWAGHVLVEDGAPYTLNLTWTVPHAAQQDASGHWRYTLAYEHQAGSLQRLTLTVTMPGQPKPVAAYAGWLYEDKSFPLTF